MPRPAITFPTDPIVFSKPQNVPSRPKKIKSPTRYLEISLKLIRLKSIFSIILSIEELLKEYLPLNS